MRSQARASRRRAAGPPPSGAMASSAALDADLARLSGSELVAHLRTTCHLADYQATARVLDARDARLAKAEAALAQAKESMGARDLEIAKAEAALAEAKKALDARDGRVTKAEAALAEAEEGLNARDARLGKVEAELAEIKKSLNVRNAMSAEMEKVLGTALAKVASVTKECNVLKAALKAASLRPVSDGGPRGEDALPGASIAASASAPRAEVSEETGPVVIDLDSSADEGEGDGRRGAASGISRKRKPIASEGRVSRKRSPAASACSSEEEDDSLSLSQLMKKKRDGDQPGSDGEPKNADSAGPSGNFPREVSPVIKKEPMEATDGGSDGTNVANFVKRRGNVELGKDGGMSGAMPSPRPLGSAVSAGPVVIKKEDVEATDDPKVANFVKGRGNVSSADNSGVSRGMLSPPPPGFAARTNSQKNFSTPVITGRGNGKLPPPGFGSRTSSPPVGITLNTGSQWNLSNADHGGPSMAGKEDSFAGQEEDTLAQVKIPSRSAGKIVESARAGSVSPNGSTGNIVLGLEAVNEQEKTKGTGHSAKVLPGANAIEEKVRGGMGARATVEQDETKSLQLKRNVMKVTDGMENQRGKHRSCKSREISDGSGLSTSDKQLASAILQPRDELHPEQTSVENSLPLVITGNWTYEADMLISCLGNKELCMQAACALYRQKKLMFQPGGKSGSSGLSKSEVHRYVKIDFPGC